MPLDHGRKSQLRDVLRDADEFTWSPDFIEHLYIEGPPDTWGPLSSCAVVALDPYDEEPDPLDIEGVRMRRALDGSHVQDIVRNLELQVAEPTDDQLVAAVRYYWGFDAFILEP